MQVDPRSADGEAEIAAVAKALAHPMRVRILRILLERRACCCGELVVDLPLSQATVSQHLKVLRSAGLIQGEVDGPRVCYCADPGQLERFASSLGVLTSTTALPEVLAT